MAKAVVTIINGKVNLLNLEENLHCNINKMNCIVSIPHFYKTNVNTDSFTLIAKNLYVARLILMSLINKRHKAALKISG